MEGYTFKSSDQIERALHNLINAINSVEGSEQKAFNSPEMGVNSNSTPNKENRIVKHWRFQIQKVFDITLSEANLIVLEINENKTSVLKTTMPLSQRSDLDLHILDNEVGSKMLWIGFKSSKNAFIVKIERFYEGQIIQSFGSDGIEIYFADRLMLHDVANTLNSLIEADTNGGVENSNQNQFKNNNSTKPSLKINNNMTKPKSAAETYRQFQEILKRSKSIKRN